MLTCRSCKETKDIEEFTVRNGKKINFCKKCNVKTVQRHYENNPESYEKNKTSERTKRPNWKRHKLTEDQYKELLEQQDYKCATCKIELATCVDHDHSCCPGGWSCGKCVRGILCLGCNTALGSVRDSIATLENMIRYINGSIV
jgi:hypothetical protein